VWLEVPILVHGHAREGLDVTSIEALVEQLREAGVEDVLKEMQGGMACCVAVHRQRPKLLLLLVQPVLCIGGRLDRSGADLQQQPDAGQPPAGVDIQMLLLVLPRVDGIDEGALPLM